ncbi:MAG TPA: hypothetical protein VJ908_08080 [Wenzhouxiangellaceae bacterium]|nr:hypothetical protein [Wenzhouxiangellaceae bacterium]
MKSLIFLLTLLVASFASVNATANELTLRGGFTGNWTDPIKNRQGVQIEVIDARRAVVVWLTYDMFGEPAWLFGTGEVDNMTIRVELVRFSGGSFPPDSGNPDAIVSETWGSVMLSFEDCNNGTMSWQPDLPGFEPGEMSIDRITPIEGLRCGQAEIFERTIEFSLDAGPDRWQGLFADFGQPQSDLIETEAEWTRLPAPLTSRRGFKLAGTNRSDDLAMMLFTPVGGLEPSTTYALEFDMTFATAVPANCVGVGGAPGESVFIKIGAAGMAPAVIEQDGDFRFNIDKGNQSTGGPDAIVVGDMANSQDCNEVGFPGTWELKTVSSQGREFAARTDDRGRLWVYALSDSGFESRTEFFVTDLTMRLVALDRI